MTEELEVGSLFLLSGAHLSLWKARVLYSKGLDLMYPRAFWAFWGRLACLGNAPGYLGMGTCNSPPLGAHRPCL